MKRAREPALVQQYLDEILNRSVDSSFDNQYQFLIFIGQIFNGTILSKTTDPKLTQKDFLNSLIVKNYYLTVETQDIVQGIVDLFYIGKVQGKFVINNLQKEETIRSVDRYVNPDNVSIVNNKVNLTIQQIEELKKSSKNFVNNINNEMTIESFLKPLESSLELKNLADKKIGARGYSTGEYKAGKGIFFDKANEFINFYKSPLLLNSPALEIPLQELNEAYTGLYSLCTKPVFSLANGENKTILLRQKEKNSQNYKFYIANLYNLGAYEKASSLDPFDAYTFTLTKTSLDTSGDQVILSVFARAFINPNTFLLDKNNQQNQTIIRIYESIFQPKREFVLYTIAAMCQTSLIKDVEKIFNNSKKLTLKSIKSIVNNNYDFTDDEADDDASSFELSVFIKGALALPPVIIKGVAEAADPNIAFSSKISLAVRIVKDLIKNLPTPPNLPEGAPTPKEIADEIPNIPVPAISIPLGFTFPFIFTPLTIAYLALCAFSIDNEEDGKDKLGNSSAENVTNPIDFCEPNEPDDPNDPE